MRSRSTCCNSTPRLPSARSRFVYCVIKQCRLASRVRICHAGLSHLGRVAAATTNISADVFHVLVLLQNYVSFRSRCSIVPTGRNVQCHWRPFTKFWNRSFRVVS